MADHSKLDVIAVDFDGTVVDHRYPDVGPDVPLAVETLKELTSRGYRIVIFTMRSGEPLNDVVRWYADRGIPVLGVNRNPEQDRWTSSPKAYAQLYIDDAAFGAPLLNLAAFKRPCVDWAQVRKYFNLSERA